MKNKKTKNLIILILILIMITSFWVISLKTNFKNGFSNVVNDGLSLEELQEEINIIFSKSPLTKKKNQPTTDNNTTTQLTADDITKKLADELKNNQTTTPTNIE